MQQNWKLRFASLGLAVSLLCTGGTAVAAAPTAARKPLTKCDNTPLSERIPCLAKGGKLSIYAIPFILIVGHATAQQMNGVSEKDAYAEMRRNIMTFMDSIRAVAALEEKSPTAKAEIKRLKDKAEKDFAKAALNVDDALKKAWLLSKAVYYGTLAASELADFIADPELHKTLTDINKGFKQMDAALGDMNKGVDQVNRGLKKMNKGVGKANSGLATANKGIADANKAMGELKKAVPGIGKGADRLRELPSLKGIDFTNALKGIVNGRSPLEDKVQQTKLGAILDLLPAIGDGKGIVEAITGKNMATGDKMGATDRLIGSVVLLRWMKAGKSIITAEELNKAMKAEKATGKVDGWLSKKAYDKVPPSLKEYETLNRKGVGYRWNDGKGNGVRIDKGERGNPQPYQQVDHVVINSGGKVIGRDGKPIKGSIKDDPRAAHIPVSEWVKWKAWNKP